jgi:GT2 family glycosyltransferase
VTVLVGIVTRNRATTVPRAIESAFAQQGAAIGVAVLDDGSADATPALAARFPRAAWTRWHENHGYMLARNHLMQGATATYYASLDDDAWFLCGDEIAAAVRVLDERPNVGAIAFDILSPDRPNAVERDAPRPVAMFIGCGHVVRLAAVRAVGAYEPAPGRYGGEEKDLCLRLMDAGYEILSLPGVHVWHQKTSIARVVPKQHESGVCNDLALAVRRTPAALLPFALVMKCFKHLAFSWRHGLTRPCIRGLVLFGRSFRTIWRGRRPVRTATLRAFVRLSNASR